MTGNASQVHMASPRSWNVLLDDDSKAFPDISLLGFSIPGVSGALEPGKWDVKMKPDSYVCPFNISVSHHFGKLLAFSPGPKVSA